MKEYFSDILQIEHRMAADFFKLIDSDNDGKVDTEEIVQACLKQRGPAKALDLSLLARRVGEVQETVDTIARLVGAGDCEDLDDASASGEEYSSEDLDDASASGEEYSSEDGEGTRAGSPGLGDDAAPCPPDAETPWLL